MMWASETKPLGQWQITTTKINHDVNRSHHKMHMYVYMLELGSLNRFIADLTDMMNKQLTGRKNFC